MRSNRMLAGLLVLAGAVPAYSAESPSPSHAEIEALLGRLEASGCQFNRNGAWHEATEAKAHLHKKLDYIEAQNPALTAEQFIELSASVSSMSGKTYLVKCGNAAPVESRVWLTSELASLRKDQGAGPK